MGLKLGETVGPDGENKLPAAALRCLGRAQIVGQRLAAFSIGPRDFLGLINADEDGGAGAVCRPSKLSACGLQRNAERRKALIRQTFRASIFRLRPHGEQAVVDVAGRFTRSVRSNSCCETRRIHSRSSFIAAAPDYSSDTTKGPSKDSFL